MNGYKEFEALQNELVHDVTILKNVNNLKIQIRFQMIKSYIGKQRVSRIVFLYTIETNSL